MDVYYLGVLRNDVNPAIELCFEINLSPLGLFAGQLYSNIVKEFSKTVAVQTKPGQRSKVKQDCFAIYVYARSEGVAAVMITKDSYPALSAHSVLSKLIDDFLVQNPEAGANGPPVPFPGLKKSFEEAKNPEDVSSIMKIQRELDETKIALYSTIESVLERGEKIDDIVAKSQDLSAQSKMFYAQARKTNSCCVVM